MKNAKYFNKYLITNGVIVYEVRQIGEYMYQVKDLKSNRLLSDFTNNNRKIFTYTQVERMKTALRMWICE